METKRENSELTGKKQDKRKSLPQLFKKGQSGNPNGRPPGSVSITTEIKKKLEEVPEGKRKTYLAYLIDQILKKAVIEGDSQTIKLLWNYVDGMPTQDLTSGGLPFQQMSDDTVRNLLAERIAAMFKK